MQRKRGGQKRAFSLQQIQALEHLLTGSLDPRRSITEYALLRMGIDTMLRGGDLISLKVGDVFWNGEIVEKLEVRQQKTNSMHVAVLTPKTRRALSNLIRVMQGIHPKIDISERRLWPFRIRAYQETVKRWAVMLQLDPRFYSSHSLRRTKAKLIYDKTQNVEVVRQLLGQTSTQHTRYYLGVELDDAHQVARETEI